MVDVDDLIEVILTWGCSWHTAGNAEDAPQTVQDCYQKCIMALYEQGLLP